MPSIVLVIHNVRSAHNVGSLLRSAEGFGAKVYMTGYTPHPPVKNDVRLPHLAAKIDRQIAKTALGAEKADIWQYEKNIKTVINKLKSDGYAIAALEQAANSVPLNTYVPPDKIAIVAGSEVGGLPETVLKQTGVVLEIPMSGKKESFNVSVAGAVAIFAIKFAKQSKKR